MVFSNVVFISAWLIGNNIFVLESKRLPLSCFQICADMPLQRGWNSFSISACELLRHRQTCKRNLSVQESSVADQLCISPPEIPVEGRVEDRVKGRVKVTQPQHHRVDCIWWVSLWLYACPGEESEVREPADDESPQYGCQGDCGFMLARDGCCGGQASK